MKTFVLFYKIESMMYYIHVLHIYIKCLRQEIPNQIRDINVSGRHSSQLTCSASVDVGYRATYSRWMSVDMQFVG